MTEIIVLGAGGHGREAADILRSRHAAGGAARFAGFVDDNPALRGTDLEGDPVLGDWEWLMAQDRERYEVLPAFGTPSVLKSVSARLEAAGFRIGSARSPEAFVSPSATIGRGAILFPHTSIHVSARIGNYVTCNVGVSVSHDTVVGKFCNVNPGVRLAGNVVVGEGCYLGMGASVIQNVRIGEGATIGAGAVVIRDVPPGVTAVGVPARVMHEV